MKKEKAIIDLMNTQKVQKISKADFNMCFDEVIQSEREEMAKGVKEEIQELMYKEPKCSFEHAWNCAIEQAANCLNGYDREE